MTISYDNDRKLFIAHSTFDENEKLKQAGFRWEKVNKKWITEDYRYAESLISYCDDPTASYIRSIKEKLQRAASKSASSEPTGFVPVIYHPPTIKPFPYQHAGVEYILPRPAVLLCDEMGLGKTGQALIVMNMRHPVEVLIVCPKILKYGWLKEARKWMIGHITAYVYESNKIRYYKARLTNHNKNTTLHIIHYNILGKFRERLLNIPFNFIVSDECHLIKNSDSERSKITQELAKRARWKIFITGTPIYNRPKDLFVPLSLIDPVMFGDFIAFGKRYCDPSSSRGKTVYNGASKQDELNTILRANYMVRRMKKDVMKDLPDKIKDVIILSEDGLEILVEKEKKAMEDSKVQEEKLRAELDRIRDDKSKEAEYKEKIKNLRQMRFKSLGDISKIRKELAIKKAPYVIEFVKEILDGSEDHQSKIVVFGHHTEVLTKIYTDLKAYRPVIITGQTSDQDRLSAIRLFSEKNDTRVAVLSMGAAGTGVDGLQNFCNVIVFAELDWTPALVDQAESRLQRIGQKNTVWVYHIVADDSIDSRIVKLMIEKEAMAKEILDYRPEQMFEMLIKTTTTTNKNKNANVNK